MIRSISWTIGALVCVLMASPGLTEDKPGDGELVPLPIKYPKPAYIGTPKDNFGDVDKVRDIPLPYPAPKGCVNLAFKRPVTSSDKEPIMGQLSQITDGDKEGTEGSWVELNPGLQWVQIDLGRTSTIHAVALWHYHGLPCVFHDVIIQVSDDQDFITNVKTIFNNDKDNSSGLGLGKDREYIEWWTGRVALCKKASVQARYVRLYSKGNTNNDQNMYTEVEVHGFPPK